MRSADRPEVAIGGCSFVEGDQARPERRAIFKAGVCFGRNFLGEVAVAHKYLLLRFKTFRKLVDNIN